MSGDTSGSLADRWPALDGEAKVAEADAILLAAPPPALDLGALVTLPERWSGLSRPQKVAIRRALLEARALVASALSHLGAP